MAPFHISGISSVLYRVFIAPNLRHAPTLRPTALLTSRTPLTSQISIRSRSFQRKKDTQRRALSDYYTLDSNIKVSPVNFIDLDGKFHRNMSLRGAEMCVNPKFEHLLLVTPGKVDSFGRPDPNDMPVCKVISKLDLRMRHAKTLELERRAAKGQGAGKTPKNLELNWAAAPGDLAHRLKKMQEFLREGRKVEILLGPKRKGRVATAEECKVVLQKIREAVAECKGAVEKKEPVGSMGSVMTLVFEGKPMEKKEKTVTGEGKDVRVDKGPE